MPKRRKPKPASRKKSNRTRQARGFEIDYHHFVFADYFSRHADMFRSGMDARVAPLRDQFMQRLGGSAPLSGDRAVTCLAVFQQQIEDELSRMVGSRCVEYWLHLYRRILPSQGGTGLSNYTVGLFRQITECTYLKYGSMVNGPEIASGKDVPLSAICSGNMQRITERLGLPTGRKWSGVFLGTFEPNDYLAAYQIERLAVEYWHLTACIRRVYKGGALLCTTGGYAVHNTDEVEGLMRSYDRRIEEKGFYATKLGVALLTAQAPGGTVLLPSLNHELETRLNRYLLEAFGQRVVGSGDFTPNFIWLPFDMEMYYQSHIFCQSVFMEAFPFSLEDFVHFLFVLGYEAILATRRERQLGWQMIQRAYRLLADLTAFLSHVCALSTTARPPGLQGHVLTLEVAEEIAEWFSLGERLRDQISLATRGPRPLFIRIEGGSTVLDYAAMVPILTSTIAMTAGVAEKGIGFEQQAAQFLSRQGANIWSQGRVLHHHDGTSKQVDVAVVAGELLFICEAKSHSMSWAFEIGDDRALAFRKGKMIDALDQAEEKARWIAERRHGTNYEVPAGVRALVPVALSPFVEYIWSASQDLWLTADVPRVCTPTELASALHSDLDVIRSCPFVINLPSA